ncbi:MAG TPA: SRPBCC family protein [Candidatus Dormibacteraeota bacterium]|nr:SRPBCC family protein [Candidatus Dormibacteraeota bacterium]
MIENDVDIDRAVEQVFAYCSDHTNELMWNPAMRYVKKLTEGPIGVGTRYEMEFVPARPMVGECVSFDPPKTWAVAGRVFGMNVVLGGTVTPTEGGSHLKLLTEFRAGGPLALALPLVQRQMKAALDRDILNLKAILEKPAVTVGG